MIPAAQPNMASRIRQALIDVLSDFPGSSAETQGFTEYEFLGWPCRNPITIENLFQNKFWREFDPLLKGALQEIRENNTLDRSKLNDALMRKYGVQDESLQPNAYSSLPREGDVDLELHQYFLQPFRLFGITANNRKAIGNDQALKDRQWLWSLNGSDNRDSAPLFRIIIQLYILSEILENGILEEDKRRALTLKKEVLFKRFTTQARALFSAIQRSSPTLSKPEMRGDPEGLLSAAPSVRLSRFNEFMDIASFYPLGRLLFGQTSVETHHLVASKNNSNIRYIFSWLFSHLNLTTSFFWINTAINTCIEQWNLLRNFVCGPNPQFKDLLTGGFLFIPNAILVASTPMLILLPWIYGLTSLPFTLLRALVLHGNLGFLKHFMVLKILDGLELIKDSYLFLMYAIPVLVVISAGINAFLPATLLSIGAAISTGIIFILLLIIESQGNGNIYIGDIWKGAVFLGYTNYFQLMGLIMFTGLVGYLGLGLVARQIAPYVPQVLISTLMWMVSPVLALIKGLGAFYRRYIVSEERGIGHLSIPNSEDAEQLPLIQQVDPLQARREAAETALLAQINSAQQRVMALRNPGIFRQFDQEAGVKRKAIRELEAKKNTPEALAAIEVVERLVKVQFT